MPVLDHGNWRTYRSSFESNPLSVQWKITQIIIPLKLNYFYFLWIHKVWISRNVLCSHGHRFSDWSFFVLNASSISGEGGVAGAALGMGNFVTSPVLVCSPPCEQLPFTLCLPTLPLNSAPVYIRGGRHYILRIIYCCYPKFNCLEAAVTHWLSSVCFSLALSCRVKSVYTDAETSTWENVQEKLALFSEKKKKEKSRILWATLHAASYTLGDSVSRTYHNVVWVWLWGRSWGRGPWSWELSVLFGTSSHDSLAQRREREKCGNVSLQVVFFFFGPKLTIVAESLSTCDFLGTTVSEFGLF